MSTLFGGAAAAQTSNTVGDLKGDVAVPNPPEDSISDLSFNPSPNDQKDFMAVASWDKKVRIYEVNTSTGASEGRLMYEHNAPVFSCHFSKDGKRVVSAGADNQARLCDLETGKNEIVAQHDQPIRATKFFEIDGGQQMIVTGSWDKTIKYWDLRQQQPVAAVQLQERVYTMDVKDNLLVVGTADRYINVVNLKEPTKLYKTLQSPLKWQTRVVSCFNDSAGFAIGSIEGRCAIQYVEDKDSRCVPTVPCFFCPFFPPLILSNLSFDRSSLADLLLLAPTSRSDATATRPKATRPRSTLSTTSPSIRPTAPSRPPAPTARSTSGTRTPSTASRATLRSAAASLLPSSTAMARSLSTPCPTTGPRATRATTHSTRPRSCCTQCCQTNASRGPASRSGSDAGWQYGC